MTAGSIPLLPEEWSLIPATDHVLRDPEQADSFRAADNAADDTIWLRLADSAAIPKNRYLFLRYSGDPLSDPERPVLRFVRRNRRTRDIILPAPYAGAGHWFGLTPRDFEAVWICPTRRQGMFQFRIDVIRPARLAEIGSRLRQNPKRFFYSAGARLAGLEAEADLNARWALGAWPVTDFSAWRAERTSSLPVRAERYEDRRFYITVHHNPAAPADRDAVAATAASLLAQTHQNWRAEIAGFAHADPRFGPLEISGTPGALGGLFMAGDMFEPTALSCFAAHFARSPNDHLAYCDEMAGERAAVFKPDWSPAWERGAAYVGRAGFFQLHGQQLQRLNGEEAAEWPLAGLGRMAAESPVSGVGHVRRALFTPCAPCPGSRAQDRALHKPPAANERRHRPRIGLIIPTRDRADLLRSCLNSVFKFGGNHDIAVLVADNDSCKPETFALFEEFRRADPRFSVLPCPGPFNFSEICNRAAHHMDAEFFIFLNNDVTARQSDWIDNLLCYASQPDIGAVGAKLLYPGGRVQHNGIVLGLGGIAAHFGAGMSAHAPGWLQQNCLAHETSATTGACLMVERRKFEAVGGFDAANLPVELNDVDLCLRLGERGWRTVCDAATILIHHESASRGGSTFRLQKTYDAERAYFQRRWRARILDDPCYNPALSLYAWEPMLA